MTQINLGELQQQLQMAQGMASLQSGAMQKLAVKLANAESTIAILQTQIEQLSAEKQQLAAALQSRGDVQEQQAVQVPQAVQSSLEVVTKEPGSKPGPKPPKAPKAKKQK